MLIEHSILEAFLLRCYVTKTSVSYGQTIQVSTLYSSDQFIYTDCTFEAFHTFFSAIKSTLCHQHGVNSIEIRIPKNLVFGSDEEKALTKAIVSVFPSPTRTLCTKHLKDNVLSYMKNEALVPEKDRQKIADAIFAEDGITSADDSSLFDKRSASVLNVANNYPKLLMYFTRKVTPTLKNYVLIPANKNNLPCNWTNFNCESLSHIMKLNADWKPGKTPEMIELLYQMKLLHFKDFPRALYGSGKYRLVAHKKKRYGLSTETWRKFNEEQQTENFNMFVKNITRKKEESYVKSSYSQLFCVQKPSAVKKPGQRKRVRNAKTSKRY